MKFFEENNIMAGIKVLKKQLLLNFDKYQNSCAILANFVTISFWETHSPYGEMIWYLLSDKVI